MKTAGSTPRVSAPLDDLTPLLCSTGPFATVVMDTDATLDNPGSRALQRWKPLRAELALNRTPDAALDAIESIIEDAHHQGHGLLAVADGSGLRHVAFGPVAPPQDRAWWDELPRLGPEIGWRQNSVPHLIVRIDRKGADITAVSWSGDEREVTTEGSDAEPIRKVGPGGWSQKRFQQRAEQTWERNAEDAAAMVTKLAQRIDARLVVVAGDVRAVTLLEGDLPDEIRTLVRVVEGGRAADGSDDQVAAEIDKLVVTETAAGTVALLEKFKEELGQVDRAVTTIPATLSALTAGQVDVLLIHDDPDDNRPACYGDDPIPVARDEKVLRDLGVANPRCTRLVDVAYRAALGTGAQIHLTPAHGPLREGIGAILRWR